MLCVSVICANWAEYLRAFLSDSESSFLGGAVFGTDLIVIDGVKKSSSSDIESNMPTTFLAIDNLIIASE